MFKFCCKCPVFTDIALISLVFSWYLYIFLTRLLFYFQVRMIISDVKSHSINSWSDKDQCVSQVSFCSRHLRRARYSPLCCNVKLCVKDMNKTMWIKKSLGREVMFCTISSKLCMWGLMCYRLIKKQQRWC